MLGIFRVEEMGCCIRDGRPHWVGVSISFSQTFNWSNGRENLWHLQ